MTGKFISVSCGLLIWMRCSKCMVESYFVLMVLLWLIFCSFLVLMVEFLRLWVKFVGDWLWCMRLSYSCCCDRKFISVSCGFGSPRTMY